MTLAITLLIVLGTIVGAVLFGRQKTKAKSVEDWALGGRQFGTLIFWFLNAGEIYTTFAVLGISGFAWAYGAPAYLAFCSVSLTAVIGYWLMPKIWKAGKVAGLVTQADFFSHHYRAPWLGTIVAIAGIASLVVYVQIQIAALSLILRMTLGASISPELSAGAAAVCMLAFVFLAGLRSAAFAAGVKDILMLLLVVVLCTTIAGHVGASSLLDIFKRVQEAYPAVGTFPGRDASAGLTTTWFITAALNVALGTWIFPHMFQLCFSASGEDAIRRNAILQPLYSLSYFFIILLGFGALLAGTLPPNGDINAVLLQFVSDKYPAWMVGLLTGTACLLALVPGSVLLLTCGSILSRNVVAPLVPALGEKGQLVLSRVSMIGFAAVAVWLTLGANKSLVQIGLGAYASIGMLAPGVFLAFLMPKTSPLAVLCGIVVGYTVLLVPVVNSQVAAVFPAWDMGLVAMLINGSVVIGLSLVLPRNALRPNAIG
jgi:solute:Na+ symporter, SSS family